MLRLSYGRILRSPLAPSDEVDASVTVESRRWYSFATDGAVAEESSAIDEEDEARLAAVAVLLVLNDERRLGLYVA